jgi:glycosyltransferase involved in cell wall biosynthesis
MHTDVAQSDSTDAAMSVGGSRPRPDGRSLAFISWAPFCSRSDSIAARLGGTSYKIYAPFCGSHYLTVPFKYLVQSVRSLFLLMRVRPAVVYVMAPPVVACLPAWLYCLFSRSTYVIDAHTGAFLNPRWKRVQFLQRFFSRRAATTLVTNEHLKHIVTQWNAHATIVSDVPLVFATPTPYDVTGACNMTLVASFCYDEPIEEFFEAARRYPDIRFHVTGNHAKLDARLYQAVPDNVKLTGYLSDSDYVGLLQASDAVIALTRLPHTMQRGAYEGLYLGKPVITSCTDVLTTVFYKGTVHVHASADSIAAGIGNMRDGLDRYRSEALELREERLAEWERVADQLRAIRRCN